MADAHSARPFGAQAWARDAAVQGDFPRQGRVWPAVIRVSGVGRHTLSPTGTGAEEKQDPQTARRGWPYGAMALLSFAVDPGEPSRYFQEQFQGV